MTDIELELSFPADDAELQQFIEKALRDDENVTVGRIRQIRTLDLLTVIELTGTAIGLADGLLGLRDRVRAFRARRGTDRGADPAIEVAGPEGEPVSLLDATDDELRSTAAGPDAAGPDAADPGPAGNAVGTD
ncbi:hypothetical protein ACFV6F_21680 [Kitasatospora phosalacinea]|uniref:hypothetical protein n=1 Tax=Kitasatospora phosalacinea TaxID=2065 RepID=UPI00365CA536